MKSKICPILVNGYLSNSNIDPQGLIRHINKIGMIKPDPLPKCLKEKCALWIEPYLGSEGYCGLMKKRENQ